MPKIRYLVVLFTGVIAGSRAIDAIRSWQEWRSWATRAPSAAKAYWSFFVTNAVVALLSLAVAALVWWLLRPRPAGAEGQG